ncbi:MAG: hypothetical protein OSB26_05915 [Woeseiaceae bacterium]|nr:hypothetical protein [Woeseiaceae bacterium]
MKYLGFYNSSQAGEPIDSDSPIEIEGDEFFERLLPTLKEDGEFLGVIDSGGTVLQVAYLSDEDEYWIETPRPDLGGSFGAKFDFDASKALLNSLEAVFPEEGFESFQFQSWK